MPRIAVVQNGTDVARSSWADVVSCYEDACALLSQPGGEFTPTFYADESVAPLLESLNVSELDCIVFATNALTSDQVVRAVTRHTGRLRGFLRDGGGLVVLHQWLDSLAVVLPDTLLPTMNTRRPPAPDVEPLHSAGADDALLHVPGLIDPSRLHDRAPTHGPSWLFFKSFDRMSMPDGLASVLVKDDEQAVLVRSKDHRRERIVLSTLLLDWQHDVELLANVLRFAATGLPRRLIWRDPKTSSAELLHRWLGMDGASLIRSLPSEQIPAADSWLLTSRMSTVEALVVPPELLDVPVPRQEVLAFLGRGGTIVTADRTTQLPASRITALVGSYSERALADRLQAELRAVDGWSNVESAFDLRNIVAAAALLEEDPANHSPLSVTLEELAPLAEEACARLGTPRHQEDVSSSIALAQSVALLLSNERLDPSLVSWMAGHPLARDFDAQIQVRAVRSAWAGTPDPAFMTQVANELAPRAPGLLSPAPAIRCLDSLALLGQLHLLGPTSPEDAVAVAHAVDDILTRFPANHAAGWVSVEATADVLRGLITLLGELPDNADPHDHLAVHIATGADVLRRALERYERNPRGVSWRARLTHALVLADRRFPIGLQRLATLQWPESPSSVAPGGRADRTLVEHLGSMNFRLREQLATAKVDSNALTVDLRAQRLAVAVGRGSATVVPTVIIVGGAAWVAALVGASSFLGLMTNLGALLTTIVTLLGLLFSGLARVGLLAAPGRPLLTAAEKVAVPVVTGLGKLKKA